LTRANATDDDYVCFSYDTKVAKQKAEKYNDRTAGQKMFEAFVGDWNSMVDMVGADGEWRANTKHPAVVIVDGLRGLQDILLDFIVQNVGKELGAPGSDSRTTWGMQQQKVMSAIKSLKALPCVGIVTAHERLTQNELTSEVRIDPDVTGQLAQTIGREFSSVVYSRRKGDRFVWETRPTGLVKAAGVRLADNLPPEIPQDYSILLGLKPAPTSQGAKP